MKCNAIIYVPSDTPEAMTMATRRVAGVPIIIRGIMTLAQANVKSVFLLVAETQQKKIEDFLERYPREKLPEIEFIHYDEPYRVSPSITSRIASSMESRCLLLNANLLLEKDLVEDMINFATPNDKIVTAQNGAHPLPLFSVPLSSFSKLDSFTNEKPRSVESCIRFLLETTEKLSCPKRADSNVFLVTKHRDRAVAEKSLAEAIRHRVAGPIAKYINKRISLPVSLLLSKLWVSPNTITAFNILIGVFSGVFVADGHRYDVILLGAALFQLASIIDGCDGEVAKLTFRCSKFGQYADTLCDNLSLGSFMTGLIAGYWRNTHSVTAFTVGAVMIVSTAVTFFWMIKYLKKNTQSASLVTFDKEYISKLDKQPRWLLTFIKYAKYTIKKDFFSFAFFCFAVAGVLYWWLFLAAIGTFVSAIILTYLNITDSSNNRLIQKVA